MTPDAEMLLDVMFDAVEAADIDAPDMVDAGHAFLAVGLSKLDQISREALLAAIETGSLRRAIARFGWAEHPRPAKTTSDGKAIH
jgi:hypothetical protein